MGVGVPGRLGGHGGVDGGSKFGGGNSSPSYGEVNGVVSCEGEWFDGEIIDIETQMRCFFKQWAEISWVGCQQ
eukprot:2019362-Karenia_brevis.AAC.1